MEKAPKKRTTVVREHARRVKPSRKNPGGTTLVDRHTRRLPGDFLGPKEIQTVFAGYDRRNLNHPVAGKLQKFKNADRYDELIAVWTGYFNQKFNAIPALDPDVVKALIASESGFRLDPPENKVAIGIAQITKNTWRILQDPNGEAKDFIFKGIRQKDLKKPDVAIPMAVRWLFRKRATAAKKLGRMPTHEELIQEYKGLLTSKSEYKENALRSYLEAYAKLKSR